MKRERKCSPAINLYVREQLEVTEEGRRKGKGRRKKGEKERMKESTCHRVIEKGRSERRGKEEVWK